MHIHAANSIPLILHMKGQQISVMSNNAVV